MTRGNPKRSARSNRKMPVRTRRKAAEAATSVWPALCHGTSSERWASIQKDGVLRRASFGVQAVSMTDEVDVAAHFAEMAVVGDLSEGVVSKPVILIIDAIRLLAEGFKLEAFSDPIWGERQCDWERELLCWDDIPIKFIVCALPVSATGDEQREMQDG